MPSSPGSVAFVPAPVLVADPDACADDVDEVDGVEVAVVSELPAVRLVALLVTDGSLVRSAVPFE
jgi:hypothetical protein